MPRDIFISYRRDDEPGMATALYLQLERAFSEDRLFMDVEGGIGPGHDFVRVLEQQVAQCTVMLAIVGKGWLTAADANGVKRLDNPEDFVRIEIESAMRLGKRVIPVLLNRTEMPHAAALPDTLKPFARLQAVRMTHERLRADSQGIVAAVKQVLDEAAAGGATIKQRPEKSPPDEGTRSRPEASDQTAGARMRMRRVAMGILVAGLAGLGAAIYAALPVSRNPPDTRVAPAPGPSGSRVDLDADGCATLYSIAAGNPKTVALVISDADPFRKSAATVREKIRRNGLTFVLELSIFPVTTDYVPFIQRVVDARPDVIVRCARMPDGFLQQLHQFFPGNYG